MSRSKGSLNKKSVGTPSTLRLTIEARIAFLANLIVDRIERDKKDGQPLLKKIGGK